MHTFADVRVFKKFLLECNIARGNGSSQIEILCNESSYLPVYVVPLLPTCLKAKKKKKSCSCVTCTYAVAVTYPAELELSPVHIVGALAIVIGKGGPLARGQR